MDIDDSMIVTFYKKNRSKGFNLLYSKFNKHVYSICYRYTNSKEDSLDLTQEVFIKIYRAFDSFEDNRELKPWISKITVNTCLNHIRTNKKFIQYENTGIDTDLIDKNHKSTESTEDIMFYSDTKKIIESEVFKMPEMIKMVFILRHFNKMSYTDIAKTMSIPLGTVKTNLFKSRRILKEALINRGIWEV